MINEEDHLRIQVMRSGLDLDATMTQMVSGFMEWSQNPQGGHRAPGQACLSGCRALKEGVPWPQAGGKNAGGCGSVMRAYPFGLIFHDDLERAERWAALHSSPTHRDPIALAACAAGELCALHVRSGALPHYGRQFHPARYGDAAVMAEISALDSDGQL